MRSPFPLALFWFLSFSGFGIFFLYFALSLRESAGLDGTQIGLVLSIPPLVGLVAQPLWGYAADRTGARRGILILVTAGAPSPAAAVAPRRPAIARCARAVRRHPARPPPRRGGRPRVDRRTDRVGRLRR
jgi:nitrate/nitrite transporter NarK